MFADYENGDTIKLAPWFVFRTSVSSKGRFELTMRSACRPFFEEPFEGPLNRRIFCDIHVAKEVQYSPTVVRLTQTHPL